MKRTQTYLLLWFASVLLAGCAAEQLPGFQNAYQRYTVPAPLVERVKTKFREHGLKAARIERDSVGRLRLAGTYRNEDEVDQAFIIVQSIVGLKSTSPFYPENVQQRRWETAAGEALSAYGRKQRNGSPVGQKRALVIGINEFLDNRHLLAIQGMDDAIVVSGFLTRAGYTVTALLGPQATKANIESALNRLALDVGPQDSLFIYLSSHGNAPVPTSDGSDKRKMSIMAYDSGDVGGSRSSDRVDYELNLQATSVPDTLVQNVARRPTRVTRLIVDTCFSGDMLRDVPEQSDSRDYILSTNGGRPERAGISLAAWSSTATSKGIVYSADGAPQSAPSTTSAASADTYHRLGYAIITATSADEESLGPPASVGVFGSPIAQDRMLKGSFFTQSFFEYLNQYNGQVTPAFDAARAFTQQTVAEVTRGTRHQVPRQFSTVPASQNNIFQ